MVGRIYEGDYLPLTHTNEKKAISNAYMIPPTQYWSIKKMMSEYKGHKNMQEACFLMNQVIQYKSENCPSSQSCHFVKNYFFSIKLLHANFQCACNVKAKYQVNPSKAVIGVDWPVYALS